MDDQTTPIILCVDDDQVTLDMMARYLTMHDVTAITATGGREALKHLEVLGRQVELIFLDLAMPEMSGFELALAIRQRPAVASIPIIAVTARADEASRECAESAGIDYLVSKPFHPQQLVDILVANGVLH